MIKYDGLWWPDGEDHRALRNYMLRRVTDVDLAIRRVETKCVAVQAGGFVGMWPIRLAKTFERVYTFEPIPEIYDCLVKNTQHLPGVITSNSALGDSVETPLVHMSGGRTRDGDGRKLYPTTILDELELLRVDALFLDIEGGELAALRGAEKTIAKHRPILTVEFHPNSQKAILEWALDYDYMLDCIVHADAVFVPQERGK